MLQDLSAQEQDPRRTAWYATNEPLQVFTDIFDSMDEISPIVHGINEKASLNSMIS